MTVEHTEMYPDANIAVVDGEVVPLDDVLEPGEIIDPTELLDEPDELDDPSEAAEEPLEPIDIDELQKAIKTVGLINTAWAPTDDTGHGPAFLTILERYHCTQDEYDRLDALIERAKKEGINVSGLSRSMGSKAVSTEIGQRE